MKQLGYIEGASTDSDNHSNILEAIEIIENEIFPKTGLGNIQENF